jgi:hypothetical protein
MYLSGLIESSIFGISNECRSEWSTGREFADATTENIGKKLRQGTMLDANHVNDQFDRLAFGASRARAARKYVFHGTEAAHENAPYRQL